MARKEDMLPPGWEDLDRYVDLLFRLAYPLGVNARPPFIPLPQVYLSGYLPSLWNLVVNLGIRVL